MKIKKSRIQEIIKEEIYLLGTQKRLNEALTTNDYKEIRDIIRAEVADIMFQLFKKRQMWI